MDDKTNTPLAWQGCNNLTSGSVLLYPPQDAVVDCISQELVRSSFSVPTRNFSIPGSWSAKETAKKRQESFINIYKTKVWGGANVSAVDARLKSVIGSGPGSTLDTTQEAMGILHTLINELKRVTGKRRISLLDIPCGDFVWMNRFLQLRPDIDYTGMDIVPHLIKNHATAFESDSRLNFTLQDIVETPLDQAYDIIFCRMMMQHLSQQAFMAVLSHFSNSGSHYLLTTTHAADQGLRAIKLSGERYRPVNLEIPPAQLSPPLCMTRDGPSTPNHPDQFLALWKLPLRQVLPYIVKRTAKPPGSKFDLYSCG